MERQCNLNNLCIYNYLHKFVLRLFFICTCYIFFCNKCICYIYCGNVFNFSMLDIKIFHCNDKQYVRTRNLANHRKLVQIELNV